MTERNAKAKILDDFVTSITDEYLRQFLAQTNAAYREGHELAVSSQERSDKMLTWFIALMGGGIFSVHRFFADVQVHLIVTCLLAWVIGIVSGVTSRVLGGVLVNKNNLLFYDRVSRLGLLMIESDYSLIRRELADLMKASGSLAQKEKKLVCLLRATNATYYLAYLGFIVGTVAAAWAALQPRLAQ